MEVPLANGANSEAGGSIARGRSAARAGPAPVLTEASIHRRREHSRQASLDMAAREQLAQFRTAGGYERTASYMAQTQSSLRHASIGSEASITGSIRRMRRRANDDDASDVASVASSQWSVRRRRVGPRTFKPVAAPVPATTTTERAQRIAARTAAQRGAAAGGEGGENGERLQGVPVVVRGGARVAASRKSSVDAGDSSFFNGQRLGLSGGGAGSGSVTTVTVSDDDTGELNKSGVSVSLSPDTSGPRSARRSMRQSRHNSGAAGGAGSGSRGGSEFISAADGDFGGDCDDGYDDPLPRATQPMSFDAYPAARAAGGGRSALAAAPAPDKAGRPPLTPRGDASPHPGAGGRRNSSLGGAQAIPATQLTSNTVHRHSNSFDFQQQRLQQRRDSAEDSATASAATGARGNGALANGTTATHRVAEGRRSGAEYDAAAGRKSAGGGAAGNDDMMDDTPISVLKARAEREAAHNARRDSDPPVVPRLALGEITANREKQRRSSSYTVASSGAAAAAGGGAGAGHVGYAPQTPMTAGSALSEVTVSSMTDSATPHVGGGGGGGTRSGRGHGSDHRASHVEDVRVDPSPSVSAVQQTKGSGAKAATYDSHGASPVREESAEVPNTTVSPSRLTVVDATASRRREDGEGVATAPPATNSNTSNARTNNNASRTNNGSGSTVAAPAGSEGQQGSTATAAAGAAASTPAASRTAGKGASAAAAAPATKSASRQASPEPKAPAANKTTPTTAAAAAPTHSSPTGSKKQRAFEKQPSANAKGTTASPLPPANAASKEKASCCAVM